MPQSSAVSGGDHGEVTVMARRLGFLHGKEKEGRGVACPGGASYAPRGGQGSEEEAGAARATRRQVAAVFPLWRQEEGERERG